MRHETFAAPEGHVAWIDEIDDVLELLDDRVRVP
jgi:hypothetical protein